MASQSNQDCVTEDHNIYKPYDHDMHRTKFSEMSYEILNDSKTENEEWLQVAIDKEYINYQKYSTFENVEKIGEGAMGEVFKATSSCYGETVAIKKYTKFTINETINEVKNFAIL